MENARQIHMGLYARAFGVGNFPGSVRFDSSGKLTSIEQVLDEEHFARIKADMTQDDVLHLIGPSFQIITYPRTGDTSWDYRYRDTWSQTALFSVIFDQADLVKGTFKQREVGNGHNH